jgi:predicted nucleic acid-binding OB-fold protein
MTEELINELRELSLERKDDLKREKIELLIGDDVQDFRISGIGAKSIKIEKYIRYEDIVDATEDGREGLESVIRELVENYNKSSD